MTAITAWTILLLFAWAGAATLLALYFWDSDRDARAQVREAAKRIDWLEGGGDPSVGEVKE